MGVIKVFHGSDHIIKSPLCLGGKEDNDYGNGFYVTEYEDRAKSWAALNGNPQKVKDAYKEEDSAARRIYLSSMEIQPYVRRNRGKGRAGVALS